MACPFLYLRGRPVASPHTDTGDSDEASTPPTSLFPPTLVSEDRIRNESRTYISHIKDYSIVHPPCTIDKILFKMFNPLNFSLEDTYDLQIFTFF